MKKKRSRKVTVTPEQAKRLKPDKRFVSKRDKQLVSLVASAMQRKIRVRSLTVPPTKLAPHNPEALTKARANLAEEPTLTQALESGLRDRSLPAILVYRDQTGTLCCFDDYLKLAVALECGLPEVRVVVLGEGNEWIKKADVMPTIQE